MKTTLLWSTSPVALRPLRKALALQLLEGAVAAVNPIAAALALHAIVQGASLAEVLPWLTLVLAVCFGLRIWLLNYASQRLHHIAFQSGKSLRLRLLTHLVSLPLVKFREQPNGKIAQIMSQNIAWAENFAAHGFPTLLADLVTVLFLLLASILFFQLVGFVALGMLVIGLLFILWLNSRIQTTLSGHNQAVTNANRDVIEFAQGIEVIRSSANPDAAQSDFDRAVALLHDSFERSVRKLAPLVAMMEALSLLALATALVAGTFALRKGVGTAADLYAALILLLTMLVPLRAAFLSVGPMVLSRLAMTDILNILSVEPLPEGKMLPPETLHTIEFDQVTARHGDKVAVQDISFCASKGSLTALVGPSGAGKTTLFNLMLRFLQPEEGHIRIDGVDIQDFAATDYMNRISVVFQESQVFDDTVFHNIRIARPDATEEDIIQAAKSAQIHDRIMCLPSGYDTRLGSHGGVLSGGERQRLTIARAFLKQADIVLLDEATSALDPENEHLIQRAFRDLAKDRTVFVIAHRLTTICDADQILVLDNGRLRATGRHKEVLNSDPVYQNLWACYQRALK